MRLDCLTVVDRAQGAVLEFDAWGQGWEYEASVELIPLAVKYRGFIDALGYKILDVPEDEEDLSWFEDNFVYGWELRRLFWSELLPTGQVRVRFMHDGEKGQGRGPVTLIRAKSQSFVAGGPGEWPNSDSFVIASTWNEFSDQLYMYCIQANNLFAPYFAVENLVIEELDSDLYEHSFSSVDEIRPGASRLDASWGSLEPSQQREILANLIALETMQPDAFSEVWLSCMDVVAMIVAHPETHADVVPSELFELHEELTLLKGQ
jgi:hypothetical protein